LIDFNGNIADPTGTRAADQRAGAERSPRADLNSDPPPPTPACRSASRRCRSRSEPLNTNLLGANDGRGSARLDWMRGDTSNEGTSVGKFRRRPVSRLGDIVNSNPQYVAAPGAGYWDSSYAAFRQTHINRTPVIYLGATTACCTRSPPVAPTPARSCSPTCRRRSTATCRA
jgi:hypothetical protein